MNENDKKLRTTILRRYDLLEALYPNEEYYISKLADKTGINLGNVSKYVADLKEMGLVSIREVSKRPAGRKHKYIKLTRGCRDVISSLLEITKPAEFKLSDPNSEEVNFLLEHINKPPSDEVREQAIRDLKELCLRSRIWKAEFPPEKFPPKRAPKKKTAPKKDDKKDGFWSFINKTLNGKSDDPEKAMGLLGGIARNASAEGEKEVIKRIRNLFASRVKGIAGDPKSYQNLRIKAIWVLDSMRPSNKEKWDIYTDLLEKSMKGEGDKTYHKFSPILVDKFEALQKWNNKRCRDLFYKLLSASDPRVRKRASSFYASLRSPKA